MVNRRLRRKLEKKEITTTKALNRTYTETRDHGDQETIEKLLNGLLSEHSHREEPTHKAYSGGPLGRAYRPLWRLWPIRSRHGAVRRRFLVMNSQGEIITGTTRAGLQEWIIERGAVKSPVRRTRLMDNKRRAG